MRLAGRLGDDARRAHGSHHGLVGQRDRVIGSGELRWTSEALGVDWPLRIFPDWGHYPMIDEPEAWVAELRAFLSEQ